MIHQYKLNGYNIVLNVYRGSVRAVDELAYAAITLVDAGHPHAEKLPTCWQRNMLTIPK